MPKCLFAFLNNFVTSAKANFTFTVHVTSRQPFTGFADRNTAYYTGFADWNIGIAMISRPRIEAAPKLEKLHINHGFYTRLCSKFAIPAKCQCCRVCLCACVVRGLQTACKTATVKSQIFVRHPFSYCWLETGSYGQVFVLSRASKYNHIEVWGPQNKKEFSYGIKFSTIFFFKCENIKYRTKICDFTVNFVQYDYLSKHGYDLYIPTSEPYSRPWGTISLEWQMSVTVQDADQGMVVQLSMHAFQFRMIHTHSSEQIRAHIMAC